MPAIVVPQPQIPCVDDPELERSGKTYKKKHA